ncbi:MAG: hypothetical protein DI640_12990 [Sphingomonas taxi]|uniref:VRR-NUC domain-containing protein n=1 Tax=Sphingomonas taxi TaxID=1549858 RepID=A0A2W4YRC5_9SPHN|nr:MAG: hypothetical protein DI640_12990 [Sphingomonas taxi]
MATPESKVKRKISARLKELGVWYHMPTQRGLTQAGTPDYLCVYLGIPFSIEAKAGTNKPRKSQVLAMKTMRENGISTLVINETNIAAINDMTNAIRSFYDHAAQFTAVDCLPETMKERATP